MNRFAGLRDFLLIWTGQSISGIGSRLSTFALGIWALRTTGSTVQFAMIYIAMDLPLLVVSPLAGALVDRWDRRRVMMACDALCALAMIALATLLFERQLSIWHVYVGVGLMSLCTAFHAPAFSASIPLLAKAEQLPRVNGLVQTGNAVAAIAGPLLAGILVSVISLEGVLAVDALTFFAAVAGLALARVPRPRPLQAANGASLGSLVSEAAMGWRHIRARRGLLGLLVLDGFKGFIFSIAAVLITPLLLSFAAPSLVGLQYAIAGGGMLLGGLALTTFGAPRRKAPAILVLMFVCGFFMAVHGVRPSFVLATVAGFIMFLTLPGGAVLNNSLWQTKVPADLQGRCFAIQLVLSNAATPLGYGLAGILSERLFEPLLKKGGALSGSVGALIGVGPGRGIGLMFIVMGVLMMVAATVAFSVKAIRLVDELPDFAMPDEWPAGEASQPEPANAAEYGEGLRLASQEAR